MADDYNASPRKWTLEEIDELLQDSGIAPSDAPEADNTDIPEDLKKAEAVDPRPVYSVDIDHKIKTKKVEHSEVNAKTHVFGALESDKYRERFLNRPIQNLEKTAEHQPITGNEQPVERGGFVKRSGSFQNTVDLEPVPVLVSDDVLSEEEQKTTAEEKTKTIGLRSLAVTDGNAHDTEIPE